MERPAQTLPRVAKGKRPSFHEERGVDQLFGI